MESKKQKKIFYVGIRREDKSKWERRVSITPKIVADILSSCDDI